MCQEANYVTKNEFSGEAHVHALANLKERTIIVMQPGAEKVMLMKYSPGWKAQDDITRQEMLTLTQNVPRPVIIHLNAHSTHFSAYRSASTSPPRAPKRKHRDVGASAAESWDLDA